jgi:hypothetical protein
MADWPDVDLLKKKLDVTSDDWDEHMENLMATAIEQVQIDVGEPVEVPTQSLHLAALILAVILGSTEGPPDVSAARRDPKYQRALKGHRVRFGIA